jgi:predicted polyphosphate/ATP-dependent NAD kinase
MPHTATPRRIGLIVNPVAGLGGRVGLKGTDGAATQQRARELGAVPRAAERAARTLARLEGAGLSIVPSAPPSAAGTQDVARQLLRDGVDLLLFAGGDGTARDILAAVGQNVPVLGIPAGVKMRSGVFAASPEAAAEVAIEFLRNPWLRDAEVVDLDEAALREDRIEGALYGHLRVPVARERVLAAKRNAAGGEAALEALCAEIATELSHGTAVLGPGTTTARILEALGVTGTLLGVDVVRDGALLLRDANEAQLLAIEGPAHIVVGIAAGQGVLFGRGNQPISAEVIRRAGAITIVSGLATIQSLDPPCLRVDTGNPVVDGSLAGYRRVRYAPSMSALLKIV